MATLNLEQWQKAVSKSFATLEVTPLGDGEFAGEISETILDDVHLYKMGTTAHQVLRKPEFINENAPAFCKLSLQIEGTSTLTQDERTCELVPGDLALYVTQRPYELKYPTPQRSMVVIFPQSLLQMSADQIEVITAVPISRNSGLGRVAVPLFEQLAQNMEVLSGPHAMSLVKSSLDILLTVLSAETREASVGDSRTQVFHQAVSYIDHHLDDVELTPQKVADALYISLRQLHTRFSERDLTVSSFIRRRRLQAIKNDLSNPLLFHESVHTISSRYGLLDAPYVSKAFKSEFGESPSAYRERIMKPGYEEGKS